MFRYFSILFLCLFLAANSWAAPSRIVSLAPNITEILFALGLDREIIGVSEQSNYPPAAVTKEKIGGQIINIEKILSLKPDLIIGTTQNNPESLARLQKLGPKVYRARQDRLADIIQAIQIIGQLTGTEKKSRQLADNLNLRLENIKNNQPSFSPGVFIFVWPNPLIAAGAQTFLDDLITAAGGHNLGARARGSYPEISYEYLIESQPDLIIIPSDIKNKFYQEITHNPLARQIKAFRDDQILVVNGDILSRPGPRIIVALENIHQKFWKLKK